MTVKINLKIFIFIAFFFITKQLSVYYSVMFFAFLHEMGHLVVGIVLKLKPKELVIMPFGISVTFKTSEIDFVSIKELIVASAGPCVNIIISLVFIFFNIDFLFIDKNILIYSNIILIIFNLIPIYPLDGGRILKAIIHIKYGFKKSVIIINKISNLLICLLTAISSVLVLYFKNTSIVFIIIYLWIIVVMENKKYSFKIKLYEMLDKK